MGYSCSAKADEALESLRDMLQAGNQNLPCNVWIGTGGEKHFYEIGREQADGAITGAVWKFLPDNSARKIGAFRIEPNGRIERFPSTTADQRITAEMRATVQAKTPR